MRVGFMGSPVFAVETLKFLLESGFDVPFVCSQPPKAKGRGRRVEPCAVHAFACSKNIQVVSPNHLTEKKFLKTLKDYALDVLVVVAYGKILPQELLNIPRLGCFNGHPSLLPRWRGAAPIARAIEAGDAQTGVSIIKMQAELDAGDILGVERVAISATATAVDLAIVLSKRTASNICAVLKKAERGDLSPRPQGPLGVCYAPKLSRREGYINWSLPSSRIYNKVRAFVHFPSTYTRFKGVNIKILDVEMTRYAHHKPAGTILSLSPLAVACTDGAIILLRLQKAGRQPLLAEDFLRGFPLKPNDVLG